MGDDKLFVPELVACIADGGDATAQALFTVARRVWADGAAERSAFGWDRLPVTHPDRLGALRVAQAALSGSFDGEG